MTDWIPPVLELAVQVAERLHEAGLTAADLDQEAIIVLHIDPAVGGIMDVNNPNEADGVLSPRWYWLVPHPALGCFISDHWDLIVEEVSRLDEAAEL